MKKIIFGITDLKLGGAERVLVDMVNKLCEEYEITIFSLYGEGEFSRQINTKVKQISMFKGTYQDLSRFRKRLLSLELVVPYFRNRIYRAYFSDSYDVEIAFLEGPITWIMSKKSNSRKIAWVHNDISSVFGQSKSAKKKVNLSGKCYRNYDQLVFVSKDNLEKFKEVYPKNEVPKRVIYNYLNKGLVELKARETENIIDRKIPSFVQVSRLVEQKAISRLIEVHKKLLEDGYQHKIYIIGDGPLKEKLKEKIEAYHLKETFLLCGQKENPYPFIKDADYFILTSYYEGLGMVILEAEILNKYILITDSAAREAVANYKDSMVVSNDEKGIYDGLKYIIQNRPVVKNKKPFQNEPILEQIKNVIEGSYENINSDCDI